MCMEQSIELRWIVYQCSIYEQNIQFEHESRLQIKNNVLMYAASRHLCRMCCLFHCFQLPSYLMQKCPIVRTVFYNRSRVCLDMRRDHPFGPLVFVCPRMRLLCSDVPKLNANKVLMTVGDVAGDIRLSFLSFRTIHFVRFYHTDATHILTETLES